MRCNEFTPHTNRREMLKNSACGMGRLALAALDATLDEFSTEASRVYLTGHSDGGQLRRAS